MYIGHEALTRFSPDGFVDRKFHNDPSLLQEVVYEPLRSEGMREKLNINRGANNQAALRARVGESA